MDEIVPVQTLDTEALDEQVKAIRLEVNANFIQLGRLLYVIREQERFKELGYETFTEYLKDRDYSRSTAYKAMFVFEYYISEQGIKEQTLIEIGIEKLNLIKDVVDDDIEEWLDKAQALSVRDLSFEVKRLTGGEPADPQPERMTSLTNELMPYIDDLMQRVPPDCWTKTYYREPAPGVVELILRVSINEQENDD